MPHINTFDIVLFSARVLVIYIVVSMSLYNLTKSNNNKELWISLLSSSVGYLLPSFFLSKHVPHPSPSNLSMDIYPENNGSDYMIHLLKKINLLDHGS